MHVHLVTGIIRSLTPVPTWPGCSHFPRVLRFAMSIDMTIAVFSVIDVRPNPCDKAI